MFLASGEPESSKFLLLLNLHFILLLHFIKFLFTIFYFITTFYCIFIEILLLILYIL